jgi:hypothetical protein
MKRIVRHYQCGMFIRPALLGENSRSSLMTIDSWVVSPCSFFFATLTCHIMKYTIKEDFMERSVSITLRVEGTLSLEETCTSHVAIRDENTDRVTVFRGIDALLLMAELTKVIDRYERRE